MIYVFSAFPRPVGDQVFPPCPLHPLHIVPTSDGGTMVAMVPHTPSPWHIWTHGGVDSSVSHLAPSTFEDHVTLTYGTMELKIYIWK